MFLTLRWSCSVGQAGILIQGSGATAVWHMPLQKVFLEKLSFKKIFKMNESIVSEP